MTSIFTELFNARRALVAELTKREPELMKALEWVEGADYVRDFDDARLAVSSAKKALWNRSVVEIDSGIEMCAAEWAQSLERHDEEGHVLTQSESEDV